MERTPRSFKSCWNTIHHQYHYEYDGLNRLLNATFYKQHQAYNSYNEQLSYDKNGNIQTIFRKGGVEDINYNITIDDLAFTYDDHSNRLRKVIDLSNNPQGFDERTDSGSNGVADTNDDYIYDEFGNMISDANKGIMEITYNHLHLPVGVSIHSTIPGVPSGGFYPPPTVVEGEISYIYNADGVKVGKTVERPQAANEEVAYQDGFQYKNAVLQFFPHPEGYVSTAQAKQKNSKYYSYVYQYKDHLGNNRVTYTKDPKGLGVEILFEDHYYPFGLKHRNYNMRKRDVLEAESGGLEIVDVSMEKHKYKFQGQERQDELGLNWDSFKWRNYDFAIGRFMSIDPLTEEYHTWSPYVFSGNRVIDARELEGLEPYILFGTEKRAKENFGQQYNGKSIKQGVEYGSNIYKKVAADGNIYYQYDEPNRGTADGVSYPAVNEKLGERVSTIHSHGEYLENYENNEFSPADKSNAEKRGVDNNIVTPDGSLKRYDVKTKKEELISINMPSDPKDPNRQNKIAPNDNPIPAKTKSIVPKKEEPDKSTQQNSSIPRFPTWDKL